MKISEMVRERFQVPKSLDNVPYTLIQTLLTLELIEALAGQQNSGEKVPAAELAGFIHRAGPMNTSADLARELLEQYTIERK